MKIKKTTLLLLLAIVVSLGIVAKTQAGENDRASGYLWSGSEESADGKINENEAGIGWIKLNRLDDNMPGSDGAVSAPDYGVDIPPASCSGAACNLKGYAWSDNAGYIDFNPAGNDGVFNTADDHCFASDYSYWKSCYRHTITDSNDECAVADVAMTSGDSAVAGQDGLVGLDDYAFCSSSWFSGGNVAACDLNKDGIITANLLKDGYADYAVWRKCYRGAGDGDCAVADVAKTGADGTSIVAGADNMVGLQDYTYCRNSWFTNAQSGTAIAACDMNKDGRQGVQVTSGVYESRSCQDPENRGIFGGVKRSEDNLFGWARVVDVARDSNKGWIKMSGTTQDGKMYGVTAHDFTAGSDVDLIAKDILTYDVDNDQVVNNIDWEARATDVDDNGTVDLTDYAVWQKWYRQAAPVGVLCDANLDGKADDVPQCADWDRDGIVELGDYAIWRKHYRTTVGGIGVKDYNRTKTFTHDVNADGVIDSTDKDFLKAEILKYDFNKDQVADSANDFRTLDVDNNGEVGLTDWAVWRKFYRQSAPLGIPCDVNQDDMADDTPQCADWDKDGFVGMLDFAIWRKHYRMKRVDFANMLVSLDINGDGVVNVHNGTFCYGKTDYGKPACYAWSEDLGWIDFKRAHYIQAVDLSTNVNSGSTEATLKICQGSGGCNSGSASITGIARNLTMTSGEQKEITACWGADNLGCSNPDPSANITNAGGVWSEEAGNDAVGLENYAAAKILKAGTATGSEKIKIVYSGQTVEFTAQVTIPPTQNCFCCNDDCGRTCAPKTLYYATECDASRGYFNDNATCQSKCNPIDIPWKESTLN